MRKTLLLALLGALAASPPPAGADATAPEPVLRGTPLLTLRPPDRVQLTFRVAAPLPTRFDGEVLGAARISGRPASLFPLGGCYAARVPPGAMRTERTYTVRLTLGATAPLVLRLPLERARGGDGRGRRLGC